MTMHAKIGLAVALAVALVPVAADAQQHDPADLRARQLEVFEDLLTRTVQAHVQSSVNAGIEQERSGDTDGDGEPDAPAAEPMVVRVGDAAGAHGLYIAGYGVLFSIQQPQVSVLPRSFAIYLNEPRVRLRARSPQVGVSSSDNTPGLVRLQAVMLERQLAQAQRMLEIQVQRAPESGEVAELQRQVEALRENLAVIAADHERTVAPEVAAEADPEEEAEGEVRAGGIFEFREPVTFYREMTERQQSMEEILRRNHRRTRAAVTSAAIDTLAHYGAVIKGLEDDDRLSVLVLPPNPWGMARRPFTDFDGGDEEYVISVRYRDIREFDDQQIDLSEFRERVEIHDRLGLAVPPGSERD